MDQSRQKQVKTFQTNVKQMPKNVGKCEKKCKTVTKKDSEKQNWAQLYERPQIIQN